MAGVILASGMLALPAEARPSDSGGIPRPDTLETAGNHRIWGRVRTTGGASLEGFLRWDRNETQWDDLLDGTRNPAPDRLQLLVDVLARETEPRRRVVELAGYRISWDEPDQALAAPRRAAIRFGLLASLQPFEERSVLLTLRDGQVQEFLGTTSDLGAGFRGLIVEGAAGPADSLDWESVERVDFAEAPEGATPRESRLHGTVYGTGGERWTGWIAWDGDEVFPSDLLDGRDSGRTVRVPFGEIEALARDGAGTRVRTRDGVRRILTGTNDVGRGNRGIRVTDPALGSIRVSWAAFDSLVFSDLAPTGSGGGREVRPLAGTVTTRGGERHTGTVLWDGDEAWSWEHLDGSWRGVDFQVEFSRVERVRRRSAEEAEVVLRDGRTLTLSGSNDVNDGNRGILVRPTGEEEWILVSWDDFEELHLHERDGEG